MEQSPNLTIEKKTNNPSLIKKWPRLEKENRTENVLVLATELTNKINKVEDMMRALQHKESESYSCVFTDSSVKGTEIEKRKSETLQTIREEAIGSETQTTYIIIFRPHPTAYRQSTKILPKRYHTVHQLYRKEESSKQRDPSFHGCYQPVHQYSSRRRNKHCMHMKPSIRTTSPFLQIHSEGCLF